MAAHAYSLLSSYIYGFVLTKMNLPFENSDDAAEIAQSNARTVPDKYPNMVEILTEQVIKPGYDHGDDFEYGLDLILDCVARVRGGD